jgi:hypothetical protein
LFGAISQSSRQYFGNKSRGRKFTEEILGAGMASADEYREYAEQCMALASSASDISDKARLMQMAQAWRDLAGKLDAKQKQSGEKDSDGGSRP